MALRVCLLQPGYSLEIPANPQAMYAHPERLNCVSVDAASGERFVVNLGPTRINASIKWEYVHYNDVKQYEHFLLHRAKMGAVPFLITCPAFLRQDFGYGIGVAVPEAYYSGPAELKEIILPRGENGLYYDIELPYIFVREA